MASQTGAATLTGAAKLLDVAATTFQKAVGVVAGVASANLYGKYPNFMKHPTTVKVKTVFIGVIGLIAALCAAFFNALETLSAAAIDYISALVESKKGRDLGRVVGATLSIAFALFQLYISLSILGVKGFIITFVILFFVMVITRIEEPKEAPQEESKEKLPPAPMESADSTEQAAPVTEESTKEQ